ncbi:DUF72 domain-containing protein [Verrucomicrobia bacterium LW23]|nr:DUF72 domain-containing protein [Verrucomicrobia bacterium LW23]
MLTPKARVDQPRVLAENRERMDLFSHIDNPFPLSKMRARLEELAARGVYVGTSSWKYEGWLGTLYDEHRYTTRKRFSQKRFEDECLGEYAETFRTVCVDAGYYAFPTHDGLAKLAAAVPQGFRFAFKVTDDVTIRHFPSLPRFGMRAGMVNAHYLDAELFTERFLGPCEAFRDKIGPLMFEFSAMPEDYARGGAFVEEFDAFLGKLPRGWMYGAEIRNASLLRPDYFAMLARHNVAHVFNSWTRMPPVVEQLTMPGACDTADFTAARFLLRPGRTYAQAVEKFSPYRDTGEVYEQGRQGIREIIDLGQTLGQAAGAAPSGPADKRKPRFLFINNRLEGSALKTVLATILDQPF